MSSKQYTRTVKKAAMGRRALMGISFVFIALSIAVVATGESKKGMDGDPIRANALRMLNEGREIFRFIPSETKHSGEIRSNCIRQSQEANWEESGMA